MEDTTMEHSSQLQPTKRRKSRMRRTRAPRRPISARLVIADEAHRRGAHGSGGSTIDAGILSEDLVKDLFPGIARSWKGELEH